MNTGGDAAEQVVRLSLEGFEVAAKLTGSAAKDIAKLLMTVLKQEITQSKKTRGKARLTNLLKSGKELKVFAVRQKDLEQFTKHAKQYGILYCVLRDKANSNPEAMVDIIARAEDASKIQRIFDRFHLGSVDKASIVTEAERDIAQRQETEIDIPTKTKGERIVEEAMGKPMQREENANPSTARTDKNPLSERSSERADTHTDKGVAKPAEQKPSVKKKLDGYKAAAAKQKEAERPLPQSEQAKPKTVEPNRQTVHQQPKKKKHPKER
ncbi:MAG: PcfB family protein [Lachnospiraceae bacterium]|nr:PcfB family protein [Lachnospiraceae bacterium]